VRIDAETGKIRVFRARRVVGEIEDEFTEMTIEQAKAFDAGADVGDLVETEQLDGDVFGRIGAQTAKQIVLQRIREVERDQVFDQFASREGELMTGTVNRVEPRAIILDVGKNVEAILATTEQSRSSTTASGQNVKAFVLEVRRSTKGPQIFVSRTHKGFLKRLFELEVPGDPQRHRRDQGDRPRGREPLEGRGLVAPGRPRPGRGDRRPARAPASRPSSAELSGEKIDVIPWSDDASVFVANALSPPQVISGRHRRGAPHRERDRPERMLSLAIGREGQNARLAARLTGWRIDIRSDVSWPRRRPLPTPGPRVDRRGSPWRETATEVAAVAKPKRGDQGSGRRGCPAEADNRRDARR
jgi:N utilization substance protein A